MVEFAKPVLFRPGVGNRGMTDMHFAAYCGDLTELLRSSAAGLLTAKRPLIKMSNGSSELRCVRPAAR
jgi:hypothetical protein